MVALAFNHRRLDRSHVRSIVARKRLSIELDKTRALSMGLAEMSEIEAFFDKGMSQVFGSSRVGIQVILVSLWVCLKAEDSSLTLAKVTSLVEESIESGKVTIEDLGSKLNELVTSSGLFAEKKAVSPTEAEAP